MWQNLSKSNVNCAFLFSYTQFNLPKKHRLPNDFSLKQSNSVNERFYSAKRKFIADLLSNSSKHVIRVSIIVLIVCLILALKFELFGKFNLEFIACCFEMKLKK